MRGTIAELETVGICLLLAFITKEKTTASVDGV